MHSWELTPSQAIDLQRTLALQIRTQPELRINQIRTIAGADCAFDTTGRIGYAGVIVYSYPQLEELQRVGRQGQVAFPYIPGLLSFREAPLLLQAFDKLEQLPDVIILDGQGIAHPRRFGIACHIGLLLDRPTIGCAKSRLVGDHAEPDQKPGSMTPLMHGDEQVGCVLRTRRNTKPIYLSVGHRLDLLTATTLIMQCVDGYRIPKPTRQADRYVAEMKRR
ncbi:MAG: Endonuclease V [Phycisphaerae bacterium]|nr:Endonuclease V [Phycisphaerae bacterium]